MRSWVSAVAAVLMVIELLGAVGCGELMTAKEIETYGSRVFKSPVDKVMSAAVIALKADGYEVVAINTDKGTIITSRKLLRTEASASLSGHAGAAVVMPISRQYFLSATRQSDGTTLLVAIPKIYRGEMDLSAQQVWALEGAAGERALWARLFDQVERSI